MKLYSINAELEQILTDAFDPATGEIVISSDIVERIRELEEPAEKKILDMAVHIQNLELEAEAHEAEAASQRKKAQVFRNQATNLRKFLISLLPEGKQIRDVRVQVWKQKCRDKLVLPANPRKIEAGYQKVNKTLGFDRKKIIAALENDEKVDGCSLIPVFSLKIK